LKSRKQLILKAEKLMRQTNSKKLVFDDVSYYYKSLCISRLDNRIEIFDISTDIYRPLKIEEIEKLLDVGVEKFTKQLSIKNTIDSIALNRNLFHIAIAKGSEKEKEFFYRKTMRRIKKLRNLLGYKHKFAYLR
tara:strand:- start:1597 stop:1998 length:402 start_codon:yes stop_codon:yes gene_type:complete